MIGDVRIYRLDFVVHFRGVWSFFGEYEVQGLAVIQVVCTFLGAAG